jgi:histidinol-phosphatase
MSKFLDVGLEAVKAATKVITEAKSFSILTKGDQSPVTKIDKQAEKVIRKIITKHFPDHGFLGEEYGDTNKEAEYIWIIDPIDGTKNFIRNIPTYSTQLALMKDNELIVGISHLPGLNELYYAEKRQEVL